MQRGLHKKAYLDTALSAVTLCRMLLSEATRAWRKGVPTVIVMESGYDLEKTSQAFQQGIAQHMETFAEFPDLTERPVKRGDMRYIP